MKTSVLIPAYNEKIVIGPTIQSLIDSGFNPGDIFIVDDYSTDGTYEAAKQYTSNVVTTPNNNGKAAAQTYGLNKFQLLHKYDYVIMLDCDSSVSYDFKDILFAEAYKNPHVDLFVGQVVNARNDGLISALRAVEYTFSHDFIKKGQDNFNVIYVSPGCASMYSTRILKRLYFDSSTLAEDMDLTLQVHSLGAKIKYIHEAKVVTQDPKTIGDYIKQITRWYRGFWQIVNKYGILKFGFKPRVNLYMLYLILDTLIANRVLIIFLSMFFLPLKLVVLGLSIDFIVFFLLSLYAAIKTKRYDISLKTPLLYPLLFLNAYAFVRSFIEVIVLRKKTFGWNKVMRYKGDTHEKDYSGAISSASDTGSS